MAPLLPTSSDASTQMGSPIDSPLCHQTIFQIQRMLTFKLPSVICLRKRMIRPELSYIKEVWPIRPTTYRQGLEPNQEG